MMGKEVEINTHRIDERWGKLNPATRWWIVTSLILGTVGTGGTLVAINGIFSGLNDRLSKIDARVSGIEDEVSTIKADIIDIQKQVSEMESTLTSLEMQVNKLETPSP